MLKLMKFGDPADSVGLVSRRTGRPGEGEVARWSLRTLARRIEEVHCHPVCAVIDSMTGARMVHDTLERHGLARRVSDPSDRRRVKVEVTPTFYRRADRIWGSMAADWHSTVSKRFTKTELKLITDFLRATTEVGSRQLERLRKMR